MFFLFMVHGDTTTNMREKFGGLEKVGARMNLVKSYAGAGLFHLFSGAVRNEHQYLMDTTLD